MRRGANVKLSFGDGRRGGIIIKKLEGGEGGGGGVGWGKKKASKRNCKVSERGPKLNFEGLF